MNAHVTYFAVTGDQLDELLNKAIEKAQPNNQGYLERFGTV